MEIPISTATKTRRGRSLGCCRGMPWIRGMFLAMTPAIMPSIKFMSPLPGNSQLNTANRSKYSAACSGVGLHFGVRRPYPLAGQQLEARAMVAGTGREAGWTDAPFGFFLKKPLDDTVFKGMEADDNQPAAGL
jgi:hypothetical protein